MTQVATVEEILSGDLVRICVARKTACGHDCEQCAGCGVTGAAVCVQARNPVGAVPGQKVLVQSGTGKVLGVAALVYLLPLVGFLLGYFFSEGLAETVRYMIAAVGAALAFVPSVFCDRYARKKGTLVYTVVQVL
ncbi:MAG: SoxR reducing system RseC family protein [Oscillospiraceae bacterium]|nr:SoxR reducing system RseC family protein [Oscillospiraceae bacterium]